MNRNLLKALLQVSSAEQGNARGYHAESHWERSLRLGMRFLSRLCSWLLAWVQWDEMHVHIKAELCSLNISRNQAGF